MSKPKVHLQAGLFGKGACGKQHVDTTRKVDEVTCIACRSTDLYSHRWAEYAGVVGTPRIGDDLT